MMRIGPLIALGAAALGVCWSCSGEPFEAAATGGSAGQDGGGSGGAGSGGAPSGGSAGSGGAACSAPQELCDGVCVDLQNNPSHCGACGQVCPSGQCTGGSCVAVACTPNASEPCYTGPAGTEGQGLCKAGTRYCDAQGSAWSSCQAQTLPATEDDCTTFDDENCDGKVNEGCIPTSCAQIKAADGAAKTGTHQIDPDGTGGAPPFAVHCEMDLVSGGWTRFNWAKAAYAGGSDPLGQLLSACKPADANCRGRIPQAANPKQLMVRDLTDNAHAVWEFDGSPIATAALKALRDKAPACLKDKAAWQPSINVSTEDFCGKGAEGGCDSFYYNAGSCNGIGGWGLMLDGDNFYCKAAFKLGATAGGNCGNADRGFLNDCACANETGELYYR